MVIKVGINGFGRIGRVIARVCLQNSDLQLSAINDPAISVEYISYLIKFDSTHGKLKGNITHTDNEISIDDNQVKVFHEKLPQSVPWHTAGVQYVVEASGMFTSLEKASGHLASNGVNRVIVTAPSVDVPMIIMGVNENKLSVEQKVMSCASSTLYCLAPIIKVLEDNFGVAEGFITSIHAMTPSLKPLDGLCLRGKHWRDHRSIHQNIIPATTGACRALGKIIPQVKDKLTGMAFRVPIVNVSVLDLTIRLSSDTTLADIVKCVEKASKNNLKNIIKISNEESVSSDFIGESHSCIFDEDSSIQLKPNFYKIICWYENEHSYACRVADSILFSEQRLNLQCSDILTCVRSRKQDEIQQTECYKKEISVSCCNYISDSSSKLPCCTVMDSKNKFPYRPFMKKPSSTDANLLPSFNKRKNELFKIWNDCSITKPIVKQNRSSFFQSCIASSTQKPKFVEGKPQTRLETVKKEFSKMINITEDLLKKTHSNQSELNSISKNDFINKSELQFRAKDSFFIADTEKLKIENEPIEKCGDCLSLTAQVLIDSSNEEEISSYFYQKEKAITAKSENKISKKQDNLSIISRSLNIPQSLTHKNDDKLNTQNAEGNPSEFNALKHDDFKEHLARTINKLIEGLSQNMKYLVTDPTTIPGVIDRLENNKRLLEDNATDTEKSITIVNQNTENNNKLSEIVPKQDSSATLDQKLSLYEKYKVKHDNINVKYIDEELKKRNIVLVENCFITKTISDDNMLNVFNPDRLGPKRNINSDILEGLKSNPHAVVIVSEESSRCASPENTNTTISNRNENKLDIYDKLDSASGTDSNNSFEINERKSQVIQITDLTNSFEDLARLDKICRIIEISDELSDKLFSALDSNEENLLKKKKWSFRDLCDRIHLDEFCNKVFGK